MRRIARESLMRSGYTVLEAGNGTDALVQVEQYRGSIQLLVTDVVMPDIDGRDLARRITEQRLGIRTLYMSGYPDVIVGRDGALAPGVAFLQKPFTPTQLLQKVRDVLDAVESPRT